MVNLPVDPPNHDQAMGRAQRTAESIRQAATELFARNGFAATSVRRIARSAGVDPALVMRHFGSKEALFLVTLPATGYFDEAFDGPLDTLGERMAAFVVNRADEPMLQVYTTLVRASDSPAVRRRLYDLMDLAFVDKLKDALPQPDPVLRARLFAAQVGGLLSSLSLSDTYFAEHDRATLVRIYGRAMQSTLDAAD
ncbi:TetR/AcrR family transcriptional regulator [Nocardia jiangxiensis]|uniref:TetR/AcrR family transcriptional regulator n=1 Tax=Nocardia jiangxiensis TaxID=282685 RepID=A0ABW6SAT9_9NOCA|nr:TetR/AcrR family transcriptional regulator [Nocardia jiangxiensis]